MFFQTLNPEKKPGGLRLYPYFFFCLLVFSFLNLPAEETTSNSLSSVEQNLKSILPAISKSLVGIDFGEEGFGSGVIVGKDGLVFTAAHVSGSVNRACTLILADGRRVRGLTLGLNASNDAGAIRITTPGTYDVVPLATTLPQRGEWVFSLGHSGGYDPNRGLVVRLGKIIYSQDDVIRTDCKLIGGDSGGPLFNKKGELIGIHSRVGRVLEDNIHVPIPEFIKEKQSLLNKEWIKDGPFTKKIPGRLNATVTETPEGLILSDLEPYEKNLREKDILFQWNGHTLKSKKDLEQRLAASYTGQEIALTIKREGKDMQVPFILRVPPPVDLTLPLRMPDFFSLPEEEDKKSDLDDNVAAQGGEEE